MFYASNIKEEDGKELSITIVEEITETDFKSLMSAFDYMGELRPMDTAYKIMLRNANEFLHFTSEKTLKDIYFNHKTHESDIALNANRLISNFCASMQTFIDYANKAVGRKESKSKDSFSKYLSSLFDNEFCYRFFCKLRNFCVHYSFPYTTVVASAPNTITLECHKSHLKRFSGWGAIVSKDFSDLPDIVDLQGYFDKLLVLLTTIQLNVYMFYAEDIFNANKAIALFRDNHGLTAPTILEIDENNVRRIRPIPISNVIQDMKMIENHPNVSITFTDNVSEMSFEKHEVTP